MIFNYHWNREEQQKYAEHRLFTFIRDYVKGFHPYYDGIFQAAEIDPRQMNSYKDFCRIPLTTPEDFAAAPASFVLTRREDGPKPRPSARLTRWAYTAGGVLAAFRADSLGERRGVKRKLADRDFALWEPVHYEWMESPEGSLPIAYTLGDMKLPVSHIAAMLFTTGYRPGMRLLNLLSPSQAGWLQMLAAQWLVHPPVSTVQAQAGTGSLEALAARLDAGGCEFLVGDLAELNAWLDISAEAKRTGQPALAGLQKVMVAGSLEGDATLELKKKLALAGAGDAQVLQGYGRPELRALFFECAEGRGIHLNPEFFYWEVLDPGSREPVKWGEPGVLTFSHFDWRGTVLLRYWTGDMVEGGLYWERCPGCGLIMPVAHTPVRAMEWGGKAPTS